jgi:hypothetical protein
LRCRPVLKKSEWILEENFLVSTKKKREEKERREKQFKLFASTCIYVKIPLRRTS